jgi:hypothetical protein
MLYRISEFVSCSLVSRGMSFKAALPMLPCVRIQKNRGTNICDLFFIVLFNSAVNFRDYTTYVIDEWARSIGGMTLTRENAVCWQTLVAVPLSLPQIPRGLAWKWTLASAVTGQPLITWTMTRLYDIWTRDYLWWNVHPLQFDDEAFSYSNFMISFLATSFFEDLFYHFIFMRNFSAISVSGDLQALEIYDELFCQFSSMRALQPLHFY